MKEARVEVSRESVLGFRLRRHHLDRRLSADSLAEATGVAGVRNSPPGTAQEALAARIGRSPASAVDAAVGAGELVEVLGPRLIATYVLAQDAAVFTIGTMPADQTALRAMIGERTSKALKADGIGLADAVRRIADAAREELADGPRSRGVLSAALTRRLPGSMSGWCQRCGSTHVSETLFRTPGGAGVFRIEPRGDREVILGPLNLPDTDPEAARLELTRRFLRAYGPATADDFAGWTNTGPSEARRRWSLLTDELTDVVVDGRTAQLLRDDAATLARASPPAGIRILPAGDPYLLARDRATLAPDPAAQKRLWPSIAVPGAVLADGELTATWRARKNKNVLEVRVTPFSRALSTTSLRAEAQVLAGARGCADVTITAA
jgi:Winged helix DNA-binding domain